MQFLSPNKTSKDTDHHEQKSNAVEMLQLEHRDFKVGAEVRVIIV